MLLIVKTKYLFDGVNEEFQSERAIVIEDDKISHVISWDEIPKFGSVPVIQHQGWVIPGLIDCHVHVAEPGAADPNLHQDDSEATATLRAVSHVRQTLQAGFTTVRNMGAKYDLDISLSKALEKGLVSGSRLIPSGRCITMTGGHGHRMGYEADGTDEMRKAVRTLMKCGAQVIKLMATGGVMTEGVEPGAAQLSYEELRVGVEEAHKAGRLTATHAQGTEGIKNALRAGIDSIEHGIFLDDEAIELMLTNKTALVPTLAAPHNIIVNGVDAGIPRYAVEKAEMIAQAHVNSFQRAYKAGVLIGLGTDAGTPFNYHGRNATELELMVKAGVSPIDALKAATSNAAKICGLDHCVGRIAPGYYGDLLLLAENPIDNLATLTEQIVQVIFKGQPQAF